MGLMEPAPLGMMAQRPRLLLVTARARMVSNAPGSKSGRKTAAGWAARRVVVLWPLAEMLRRIWAESGAAVTVTAEVLTVAFNWTCLRLFAEVSCSDLERL